MINREFSETNKLMQIQIKKEVSFHEGIETLLKLREVLFRELLRLRKELKRDEFNAIPFVNAKGYHNKTIAYSIWHTFRIEDIVSHTLIAQEQQVFFLNNYQNSIKSPIITTGNELRKQEIVDFSKELDIDALYKYCMEVKKRTNSILKNLTYIESKRKIGAEEKILLTSLGVVSENTDANWLIDYWCKKDVKELIQMPLSRHWIMHIAACLLIEEKLHK